MPKYLVVSTSGNPSSNSRKMGKVAFDYLQKAALDCEWIDLAKLDLPLCDANACYAHPAARRLDRAVAAAAGVIVAAPVYNYDVSASAKNMIELTGSSWEDKIVGFLCAAGGSHSYMSIMSLANSLMLDFRCLIVPRFVYATGNDFTSDAISSEKVQTRMQALCAETVRLARALSATK